MILAAAIPSSPRSVRWRWRDRPDVIPRGRDGRSLSGLKIDQYLGGEGLGPAARRVLRVLVSDEGTLFGFADLSRLAGVSVGAHDPLHNRLHKQIHFIRRALIADCWVDGVLGQGFTFKRRRA